MPEGFTSFLDRQFVTGFFLPALLFVFANLQLFEDFYLFARLFAKLPSDPLQAGILLGLIALIGSILLFVFNQMLYKLLAGDGKYHPANLFKGLEKSQYDRLTDEIGSSDKEYLSYTAKNQEPPLKFTTRRYELYSKRAWRFPGEGRWLAPTAFGNIFEAIKTYSFSMYGFDDSLGWARLQAVIPKEFTDLINEAKARADFWVNLRFLSMIVIAEYVFLVSQGVITTLYWQWSWIFVLAVVTVWFSASGARGALLQWGELVKSSYDIYLSKLAQELGFDEPEDPTARYEFWITVGRVFIYHDRDALVDLRAFQAADKRKGNADKNAQDVSES